MKKKKYTGTSHQKQTLIAVKLTNNSEEEGLQQTSETINPVKKTLTVHSDSNVGSV